jgi:acetyl esterase/lipase
MRSLLLCFGIAGLAASSVSPVSAKEAPSASLPLYVGPAPGSQGALQREVVTDVMGQRVLRNVTQPTLTPVLPRKGKANGTAVIVIPGGGFHFLAMDNEGWPVARWLADQGVTAFVLKYRVEPTPADGAALGPLLADRFRPENWIRGTPTYLHRTVGMARADAQAAIRMIRARAVEWKIDPKRVGLLGFSAGAITTVETAVADAPDARPDFIAPIYGHMLAVTPPASPQPLFAAVADDDVAFAKQGVGLIDSWRRAGGSVELHWYSGGEHGFGSHKKGTTSDLWFEQFMAWMRAQKLLGEKPE